MPRPSAMRLKRCGWAEICPRYGFPEGSAVKKKNPSAHAGDAGSIPESGRFPGEGYGNPLQYSCLGNPMDRGT